MADYGLRVLSASLDIQIDGTYRNNSLYKTKTVGRSSPTGNTLNATYGLVDTIPLITHQLLSATPLNLYRAFKLGGDHTSFSILFPWGSSFSVGVQVFKQGVNVEATYGLLVKNASGNTVFSSADKHFNVKGVYTATLGHGNETASIDVTVKDADNNYFLQNPFAMKHGFSGFPDSTRYQFRGIRKINSTTIRVVNFAMNYEPGPIGPQVAWPATINIVEIRKE